MPPDALLFAADGSIPNNPRLPVLLYRGAVPAPAGRKPPAPWRRALPATAGRRAGATTSIPSTNTIRKGTKRWAARRDRRG
jgi:hypothetical protein